MSIRVGLRHFSRVLKKLVVPLYPPAWNYDNLIGFIWMPEPQGYDNRSGGTIPIEVRDPYGTDPLGEARGGTYDNRT